MRVLRDNNKIVKSYMTMYEIYQEQLRRNRVNGITEAPKVFMNLKHRRDVPMNIAPNVHSGCLNVAHFNNEVVAIYVCEDGKMPTHKELDKGLRIMTRGGRTIASHHSYNSDALTYPLYCPYGELTYAKELLPRMKLSKSRHKGVTREYDADANDRGDAAQNHDFNGNISDTDTDSCRNDGSDRRKYLSRREFVIYILSISIAEHRILGTGKLCLQFVLHCYA
ncbi:hypothetical protein Aduo_018425 [Ancylostoma duodenale]